MRWLTMLVMLVVCGFAAIRGAEIAAFAAVQSDVRADAAAADRLRAWRSVPGLTAAALGGELRHSARGVAPGEASRRAAGLAQLLAMRPLSSGDWLSLAGVRVVTAAPLQEIVGALTMSYLTGPNEAAVMLERGLFGLLQWERLPEPVREQTVRDLAGVVDGPTVTDAGLDVIRGVVAAKSDDTRAQIAALLKGERASPARLARIGL